MNVFKWCKLEQFQNPWRVRQPLHLLHQVVCLGVVNKFAQYHQSWRDAEGKTNGLVHGFWCVKTELQGGHDTKKYGT
jgi:hypothetical protein